MATEKNIEDRKNLLIKNADAGDIDIQGFIIDKRAVKYYHPGSLEEISLDKAKKIQFIYLQSFELEDKSSTSEECLVYIKNDFDTGPFNHLREWNERVMVEVVHRDCIFRISLMSWQEIDQNYNRK